ncbi:MAG: CBS domain-containing protein [Armatimonadota bacterium]
MNLTASDIMTKEVVACVRDARVEEVVRTLAERGISGMPVIDVDEKVVGIISESDLLLADEGKPPLMKTALFGLYILSQSVMEKAAQARGTLARDIMTRPVITLPPDATVSQVAHTMHDKHISRVPIVNADGQLVGIVTRGDIIKALASEL